MQNAAILMLIFAVAILLYALLIALTKDTGLIRKMYAVKVKDKKLYAVKFAKILAIVSIAPALSGIAGLLSESVFLMGAVFVAGLIISIKAGTNISKIQDDMNSESEVNFYETRKFVEDNKSAL